MDKSPWASTDLSFDELITPSILTNQTRLNKPCTALPAALIFLSRLPSFPSFPSPITLLITLRLKLLASLYNVLIILAHPHLPSDVPIIYHLSTFFIPHFKPL